ncbi:MAG: hypothetical protein PHF08_03680 [Candidatus Riflebacteria bacterium]|jgi:hypothetical protein|nr:hypothetical protein [Candidatus Riflebacteria bacterium]
MTAAETWHRQSGHCTHLRKPEGLSETWTKVEAAKLPERWPGQQDVGCVPFENLAAVLFGSRFFFPARFAWFKLQTYY